MDFEQEFRHGTKVAETAHYINAVFGKDTADERTVRFWFNRFRCGKFDLKNKPRGIPAGIPRGLFLMQCLITMYWTTKQVCDSFTASR